MSDMAEDRVYGEGSDAREVFVAAGIGVVSVSVSAGRIGRFGVACRCSPRDVAGDDGRLAVATAEDVLLGEVDDGGFHETGFGPAEVVGIREGSVLAAREDGRIDRLARPRDGDGGARAGSEWTTIGRVGGNVAAIDDSLIATDAGLYRIEDGDGAQRVRLGGFEVVNDVAAPGPFVATDAGLYAFGEEWRWEIEGACRAVSAASHRRAHAAVGGLHECTDGDWSAVRAGAPEEVLDVATGRRGYAITADGTLLVGPDWRSRSLGLGEVVGIAIA